MKNDGCGGSNARMTPEISYQSARDGYPLVARVWKPANATVRVILIHGIVSHSGWYLRSCEYLADHEIEVHALDRRGSGHILPGTRAAWLLCSQHGFREPPGDYSDEKGR